MIFLVKLQSNKHKDGSYKSPRIEVWDPGFQGVRLAHNIEVMFYVKGGGLADPLPSIGKMSKIVGSNYESVQSVRDAIHHIIGYIRLR